MYVNKSPVPRNEPVENNNKRDWKELEREMVTNRMRTTSSEGEDNHFVPRPLHSVAEVVDNSHPV